MAATDGVTAPTEGKVFAQVAHNVRVSWLGYGVQVVLTLTLTPFVLGQLGEATYGVWVLATSLTGTYGLLSFGLPAGLQQYVTRYWAVRDWPRMNAAASSGFVAMSLIAALIVVISPLVAWFGPGLFADIPPELAQEMSWCLLVTGGLAALNCLCAVFNPALVATQHYDVIHAIGIVTRVLAAGLAYASLTAGAGLLGLTLANAAAEVVGYLLLWRAAQRVLPEYRVSMRWADWAATREIAAYGGWAFFITVAGMIYLYADSTLIGLLVSVAAVTPYALAARLTSYLQGLANPMSMVLFPVVATLHARGDATQLRRIYLDGSRYLISVVGLVAAIAGCWCGDFFQWWIGERGQGAVAAEATVLSRVLIVGFVFFFLGGLGGQLLQGTLRIQALVKVSFVQSLCNLAVNVPLIYFFGLRGAALGTAGCALLFRALLMPMLAGRVVGVSFPRLVRAAWLRPLAAAGLLLALLCGARTAFVPQTFLELAGAGAFSALAAVALGGAVALRSAERAALWERCRKLIERWRRQPATSST